MQPSRRSGGQNFPRWTTFQGWGPRGGGFGTLPTAFRDRSERNLPWLLRASFRDLPPGRQQVDDADPLGFGFEAEQHTVPQGG